MKNNDHARSVGEMTDKQLEQLLATVNKELLECIEVTADPNHALTAIMAEYSQEASSSEPVTPSASQDPNKAPAATMISMRIRARALAVDVTGTRVRSLANISALDLPGDFAHALADDLSNARALDGTSAVELASDLARALDRASELVGVRALANDLATALDRARDLANALVRNLDAQPVDASGADLSDMEISHLDVLDGVVWTRQTAWPPHIAHRVQASSDEIQPGIYQVRSGDEPDPHVLSRL